MLVPHLCALASLVVWGAVLLPTAMMAANPSPEQMARLGLLWKFYLPYPAIVLVSLGAAWLIRALGPLHVVHRVAWVPWTLYAAALVAFYVYTMASWDQLARP